MPHSRRDLALVLAGLPAAMVLAGGPADAGHHAGNARSAWQIMLTVFLRHDETKTVDEINAHLRQTGCTRNCRRPGWRWSAGS